MEQFLSIFWYKIETDGFSLKRIKINVIYFYLSCGILHNKCDLIFKKIRVVENLKNISYSFKFKMFK